MTYVITRTVFFAWIDNYGYVHDSESINVGEYNMNHFRYADDAVAKKWL